jgi:prepilin signal peptidase PulO-like enzyme (type II secretory pathway)
VVGGSEVLTFFLSWPESLQMATVLLIALLVGGQINRGIYRLAFKRRSIDPWSAPPPKAKPRQWQDRLPFLGWFNLKREEKLHGKGHWIRPALIELAVACGLTMLYRQVMHGETVPPGAIVPPATDLLYLFLSHSILICLMTVATFIDFDEKTIPDAITAPGAMLGLILAATWPSARLIIPGGPMPDWLHLASPRPWPTILDSWQGAALGCACLWAWCFAMVPTLVTLRWGIVKGVRFYFGSFFRGTYWLRLLVTGILGSIAILLVWNFNRPGLQHWEALLTQLVGLVAGMAIVWSVRIFASLALQQEAMGFGDVTLMAMIGSFLGWQAALLVFFLSPAGAVFVAIAQWATTGRRDIAFGPYLCLAAVFVMVGWPVIWLRVADSLQVLGWIIPALFLACLALMCGMLMLWRIVRDAIWPE